MSKQTAIQWLALELSKLGLLPHAVPNELYEQAKVMEKEQMIDAWSNGWLNDYQSDEDVKNSAEQYYNETYGNSK